MKTKAITLLGAMGLLALTACSPETPMSQQEYDQAFTQRLKEYAYSQCSLTGDHEGLEVCSDQQRQNATRLSNKGSFTAEEQITFVEGGFPDIEGSRPIIFSRVDHSQNVLDPAIDGLGEGGEGVRVYAQQDREELSARMGNLFHTRDDVDFYQLIKDSVYYVYVGESESETDRTLDNPTGRDLTQKSINRRVLDYGPQDLNVELRKFKEVDGQIFEVKKHKKLEYYAGDWNEVEEKLLEDRVVLKIDGDLIVSDFLPFGTYGEPGSDSPQGLGI